MLACERPPFLLLASSPHATRPRSEVGGSFFGSLTQEERVYGAPPGGVSACCCFTAVQWRPHSVGRTPTQSCSTGHYRFALNSGKVACVYHTGRDNLSINESEANGKQKLRKRSWKMKKKVLKTILKSLRYHVSETRIGHCPKRCSEMKSEFWQIQNSRNQTFNRKSEDEAEDRLSSLL